MYYLAKFCRICIQTGGCLLDIETKDYDSIQLSEKLQVCTDMVITRESLSTHICSSCIQKLRISYQFRSMCKKSTSVLQQYLTELLSVTDKLTADKFINSELRVSISKTLPKARRRRIGKDERCSLLKKLLSKITEEQIMHNIHINGLTKLCDRLPVPSLLPIEPAQQIHPDKKQPQAGGLRDILNFTKEYDFGYHISKSVVPLKNFDLTSLEKLTNFTEKFFYDHFGDYRDTILCIGDDIHFESDNEDELFTETCTNFEFDECFLKPFKIKKEIIITDPSDNIKKEMDFGGECKLELMSDEDDDAYEYDISSNFVQACYETGDDLVKHEHNEVQDQSSWNFQSNYALNNNYSTNNISYVRHNDRLAQIIPISHSLGTQNRPCNLLETSVTPHNISFLEQLSNNPVNSSVPSTIPTNYSSSSSLVERLQAPPLDLSRKPRTLSPQSTRCRTRGNPFINPLLKKQFQMRNFRCSSCCRRFKSPGYLKAHCTKLGH